MFEIFGAMGAEASSFVTEMARYAAASSGGDVNAIAFQRELHTQLAIQLQRGNAVVLLNGMNAATLQRSFTDRFHSAIAPTGHRTAALRNAVQRSLPCSHSQPSSQQPARTHAHELTHAHTHAHSHTHSHSTRAHDAATTHAASATTIP